MAHDRLFIVQQINNKEFIVNLEARTCTCRHYLENGVPCGHALSSIHHIGHSANIYILDAFSIATLKNTYRSNFNPIILADLDSFVLNPQPIPPPCLSPSKNTRKVWTIQSCSCYTPQLPNSNCARTNRHGSY